MEKNYIQKNFGGFYKFICKDRVIDGIKILALTGFNLFENPELLKKMKEE